MFPADLVTFNEEIRNGKLHFSVQCLEKDYKTTGQSNYLVLGSRYRSENHHVISVMLLTTKLSSHTKVNHPLRRKLKLRVCSFHRRFIYTKQNNHVQGAEVALKTIAKKLYQSQRVKFNIKIKKRLRQILKPVKLL